MLPVNIYVANCFRDISFESVLKKHFGDMFHTLRGQVYHKFVDVRQCDLCKNYVQRSWLIPFVMLFTKSFNNS